MLWDLKMKRRINMLVCELIEMLEQYEPGAEVKIGLQPNYPLESEIHGVWDGQETKYGAVYILAEDSRNYMTKKAWQEAERC